MTRKQRNYEARQKRRAANAQGYPKTPTLSLRPGTVAQTALWARAMRFMAND
jgi:hypothetical protein